MNLKELIYRDQDIYKDFDVEKYYNPSIETCIECRKNEVGPSFHKALNKKRPNLMVEVGTYQGASAIFFAQEFKRLNIDCEILCVDTFSGSITHLVEDYFYKDLKHENGFPTLYKQFLASVIKNGFQNKITPLTLSSLDGSRFLSKFNLRPDLIYIDASHEYPDVLLDINCYFQCLSTGGVIFGDDYDGWEGVRKSVDQFAKDFKINVEVIGGKWFVYKNL